MISDQIKRILISGIGALILLAMMTSACLSPAAPAPASSQPSNAQPTRVETPPEPVANLPTQDTGQLPPEAPVLYIPLEGPAALTQAEYSGMSWYQDQLVLLPQYPQRMSDQANGVLYAIPQQALLDFVQGRSSKPIQPKEVLFNSNDLEKAISQFEGFEAIAFRDQQVYLTIEAREGMQMMGYLVSGQVVGDLAEIQLDTSTLTKNPPQQQQSNRSDEAILIASDQIVTFFESNGAQANPKSHATLFDFDLGYSGELEFPAIEYRLTDATELDVDGRFWMMNYFFPGDTDLLPEIDPIRESFGAGESHSQYASVERLLEFQYSPQGITLSGLPPIQFQLLPGDESRNWEGLVRLGDLGFLLITDKFPSTILGFVAYP